MEAPQGFVMADDFVFEIFQLGFKNFIILIWEKIEVVF